MISARDVTACLVTRGDVDMQPILDSLIFDKVVLWNNSVDPDWKCAGRYAALMQSHTEWCYFQDDDTIVPPSTQQELLSETSEFFDDVVANWGHGENPDGYDDLPLVCGGAIVSKKAVVTALALYGANQPLDEAFMYEADFALGVLYTRWRHVHLPFEIRDVAYNGRRLADEPWQRDLKYEITQRARAIRDARLVNA